MDNFSAEDIDGKTAKAIEEQNTCFDKECSHSCIPDFKTYFFRII